MPRNNICFFDMTLISNKWNLLSKPSISNLYVGPVDEEARDEWVSRLEKGKKPFFVMHGRHENETGYMVFVPAEYALDAQGKVYKTAKVMPNEHTERPCPDAWGGAYVLAEGHGLSSEIKKARKR